MVQKHPIPPFQGMTFRCRRLPFAARKKSQSIEHHLAQYRVITVMQSIKLIPHCNVIETLNFKLVSQRETHDFSQVGRKMSYDCVRKCPRSKRSKFHTPVFTCTRTVLYCNPTFLSHIASVSLSEPSLVFATSPSTSTSITII